jgi:ABC-type cobalamin/Fe3+-siderophores transport system ATPase subunit
MYKSHTPAAYHALGSVIHCAYRKNIFPSLNLRTIPHGTYHHRSVQTYPNGVKALKNLSLTIGNNMFGLLGPNGAGKSTLMRTIATLQDPDLGTIDLDGLNVLTQKSEVRKILGYLPQEFGVPEDVCHRHAATSGRHERHHVCQ